MKWRRDDSGMSGIDLLTMFLVVGALVSIAIPAFIASSERARSATCATNRMLVTQELEAYRKVRGVLPTTMGQLVSDRFIASLPECPSHGAMVLHVDPDGTEHVYCSVHYAGDAMAEVPSDDPAVSPYAGPAESAARTP